MFEVKPGTNEVSWSRVLIPAFICLLLANLLVYGPSLHFGFLVNSDDQAYIFRNPYLKNLTLSNLWAMWSHVHFDSYLPVTLTSYSLDYTLWEFDPFGYHLTQLLLHTVNAFLLAVLLLMINVPRMPALCAALLFAVHPVQTETVVWISERKSLVSAFFIFLSMIFYVRHARKPEEGGGNLAGSWVCFVLALLSKSIAVMLPVIFVLYDLLLARRGWRLFEKIPFFIGSLAAAAGTLYTQSDVGAIKEYAGGSFTSSMLFTLRVYLDYLSSLAFPFSLSPYYYYEKADLLTWPSLLSYVLIPGLLIGAALNFRKHPKLAFAAGWFVLWLLPVSNLVPLTTLRQDRYLYLPMIGVFLPFVMAVLNRRWMVFQGRGGLVLVAALVILFGNTTLRYTPAWASARSFWLHVAEVYPQWTDAQFRAGFQCWVVQDAPCAVRYYQRAIRADAKNTQALNNLAAVLIGQEKYDEAKPYLERALAADPRFADPYRNLAVIAARTGKDLDKIPEWRRKYEEYKTSPKEQDYKLGAFRFRPDSIH